MTKIVVQTRSIWRRTRRFKNLYLHMIWTEAIVNLVFSLTTYLFLRGYIPSRYARFSRHEHMKLTFLLNVASLITSPLVSQTSPDAAGKLHRDQPSSLTYISIIMGNPNPASFANHRQPCGLNYGRQTQIPIAKMGIIHSHRFRQYHCLLHLDPCPPTIRYPKDYSPQQYLGAC